jgi:hypothetical protein
MARLRGGPRGPLGKPGNWPSFGSIELLFFPTLPRTGRLTVITKFGDRYGPGD